jgi:hypothetical protein
MDKALIAWLIVLTVVQTLTYAATRRMLAVLGGIAAFLVKERAGSETPVRPELDEETLEELRQALRDGKTMRPV